MQDSSSNPFIPGESEQIRQKVYERQSPLGKLVKWGLIATLSLAVLVGIALFFVVPRTTAVDEQARIKLADTLQAPDQTLKRVNVGSGLGFSFNYDNRIYTSYAEVGDASAGSDTSTAVLRDETYENNDLRTLRDYNYVRIRPIESAEVSRALATLPPELEIYATTTNDELDKAAKNPDYQGKSRLALFVQVETDKRLAKKTADDKTVVAIEASKPNSVSIAGVDYQKVRFTTTNENYRVTNVKYDECYYTIQFDQPYSVCVSKVRPNNVSATSLVEQVFDTLAFEQAQNTSQSTTTEKDASAGEKTSFALPLIRLAQTAGPDTPTSSTTNNGAATTNSTTGPEDSEVIGDDISEAEGDGQSPLLTVTPEYYGNEKSLTSIAKNQPSVVRIGTLYCADLALKYESGETATTLTDACSGRVATGVVVSSDGHIATTGHAIRAHKKDVIAGYINFATDREQMLDRLQRILDYLIKAKILLQSDADYLRTGASIGDQEALAKIENLGSVIPDKFLTTVKEEYTYAVQPSDKPIVVNRNDFYKPSFAYSDSVLKADFVASNYDVNKALQASFGSATPAADVGLIKAAANFPNVPLIAKEDLKANAVLNIIGFPAYTDSSLTIDKIRNAPVATVTKVEQAYEKEGHRLIQTNNPVLPGNDGAPVFDEDGQLVGFAVYGLSYCPDQQCFANGTVRSVAELHTLLNDNNISLQTSSSNATAWRNGVGQFMAANYTASTASFEKVADEYRFNRWAPETAKLASSLKGNEKDTSLFNQLLTVMYWSLGALAVVTVLLAIGFVIDRRRIDQLRVGHYGAAAGVTPVIAPLNTANGAQPQVPVQPQAPAPFGAPVTPPTQPVQPQFGQQVQPFGTPQVPEQSQPYGQMPQQPPAQPQNPQPPAAQPPEDPFYK